MIVYWIAAAEIVFYLSAVPLRMAFCLRNENGWHFGAGIGIFERRFARKRAMARMRDPERSPNAFAKGHVSRGVRFFADIIRHLRIEQLSLKGTLSLGDAASTALVSGFIQAGGSALHAVIPRLSLNVHPEFNASRIHIELQGMISVRFGQIILAVLISALNYANGRIAQWINTRLKAS